MKGLRYQLKSVLHDKFCLMTFLLPVIVAAALGLAGQIDFSSLGGTLSFGVLEEGILSHTAAWLNRYGTVMVYRTPEELADAVKEPSTNLIGVETAGNGIRTMVSGDELEIYLRTADTLPVLYERRNQAAEAKVQILERPGVMAGLGDMFAAAILIVAMFMGCTFNAMNMISEKEDGVAFVNEILPMTRRQYIVQKISVGFIFGCLSAVLTACICFRFSWKNMFLMLALIVLSVFVSALVGMLIGGASEGLMTGMVYIKVVMLLFMAVPILDFILGISQPVLSAVCYLVPSQATFEGILDLSAGGGAKAVKDIGILAGHCVGWSFLYMWVSGRRSQYHKRAI